MHVCVYIYMLFVPLNNCCYTVFFLQLLLVVVAIFSLVVLVFFLCFSFSFIAVIIALVANTPNVFVSFVYSMNFSLRLCFAGIVFAVVIVTTWLLTVCTSR